MLKRNFLLFLFLFSFFCCKAASASEGLDRRALLGKIVVGEKCVRRGTAYLLKDTVLSTEDADKIAEAAGLICVQIVPAGCCAGRSLSLTPKAFMAGEHQDESGYIVRTYYCNREDVPADLPTLKESLAEAAAIDRASPLLARAVTATPPPSCGALDCAFDDSDFEQ